MKRCDLSHAQWGMRVLASGALAGWVRSRHIPRFSCASHSVHCISIAPCGHFRTQSPSLLQSLGYCNTECPDGIPRQAGAQRFTQIPQPEHLAELMTGSHFSMLFIPFEKVPVAKPAFARPAREGATVT